MEEQEIKNAIEVALNIRDRLELNRVEKDALALLINFAEDNIPKK